MQRPLVLGSSSPRRREILAQLGLVFEVVAPAAEEARARGEAPRAYVERVVRAKLADVASRAPRGALVLAADTIVLVGDVVLGKPTDDEDARAMLARLSGRAHEVVTAFALRDARSGREHAELVSTRVEFRALRDDEIAAYVATGEGRDKAGAYAIQGRGAALVSRIDGSYTNVVGLPAAEVWVALRAFEAA